MDRVTVTVPATTANLGPGFDTLGIALDLHNRVRVTRIRERPTRISSPVPAESRAGALGMITEAAEAFFHYTREAPFGLDVFLDGDVPIARGLGSSVTVRLGVIAALNYLARTRLSRSLLLDLVSSLEHHPDNAAPALYGGFTIAGMLGRSTRCFRFPVSVQARFVTLIPRFEVSTEKARLLVPANFSKRDTIHSLNRTALITAAFAGGDLRALRGLFEDRIHQPYRATLIPELFKVIAAGEKAGAIGGWLSGSGSTIICLATGNTKAVAHAMQQA
jgi:homoserine kinase